LKAAADRLTRQTLQNGPLAVADSKRMVWDVWGEKPDHGLADATAHRFAKARFGEEGREGLAALLEGRRPSWAGD